MILSMTGFGRGTAVLNGREITVELRSVNSRYFEYSSRIPRSCSYMDSRLKKQLNERVTRGKVELSMTIQNVEAADAEVTVNMELARSYQKALRNLSEKLCIKNDITSYGLTAYAGKSFGAAKVVGKVRFGSIPCGRIRSHPVGEADSVPALALPAFLQIGSDGAPDLVIVRIHGCSLPKSFIRYYQLIPRSGASETADSDADGKIRTGGLPPRSQFSGHERGRFGVNGSLGKPWERDGTETEGYGHGYGSRHGVAHRAR